MSSPELAVELDESRFDRQERITWWDQERLAGARALVVGAGALGNEIVKNLVLVGVGSVVVVDFDEVEMSNLSRCVFFRPEDEGRPKAEVLAARASEMSPATEVHGISRDMRSFGTGVALRADVMIGGLDSREARLFVNRLSWRAGRPWVDGAMEGLSGVARVFSPPDSCYECTLTDADFELLSHRQSCRLLSRDDLLEGKVPTTATTSSIVAGAQVQEVVKLLHAHQSGVRILQDALVYDGANNDAYVIRYPSREDCYAHHGYTSPVELDTTAATTFRDLTTAAGFAEGIVELGDDYLRAWDCTTCHSSEPASGAVSLLSFADAECPTCKEARQPMTTTAVSVPGDDADTPLERFGTRVDEVFPVRQGMDYRYVWAKRPDPDLPEAWR